jgi:transposase-like protein
MRKPRHTEEERRAIIARTLTSGRPIAEIAAAEGISRQTIQGWMRAPKERGRYLFKETVPVKRQLKFPPR